MTSIKHITVIGDGGWGTTLAVHLAKKKYSVTLWGPFPQYLRQIQKTRRNSKFLPGVVIPNSVHCVENLKEAIEKSDLIVFAIPSQYARSVLRDIKHTKVSLQKKIFVSVTKGVEIKSLKRISEIVHEELGRVSFAVLSGPTIAPEVARGIPSMAVVASSNAKIAETVQQIFNSNTFRIYTNSDVRGVELAGSIKNVIAIACGVCDGLGFGTNTKSAVLARGLAEMIRLGKKLGAKEETFYGLAGLGDLATTCFSPQSRNRSVGEALGKGSTIKQIISSMHMVAEGVETSKALYQLSRKYNIAMPISTEVYNLLFKNKKPAKALADLMGRQLKSE